MYEALSTFVLRAPLLPERDLWRADQALLAHRLGADALRLASDELADAKPSEKTLRAIERYGRGAAFRATPRGLLAGVCLGQLGARTAIATGAPAAWLAPTWGRLAALGRGLLDDEAARARTRLRAAPSLVRGATAVRWLGAGQPGDPFLEERRADLDEQLTAILDATARWTDWARVRRAVARATPGADALELDELLLLLIDDGLLQADVTPPLVGQRADAWMRGRLRRLGAAPSADGLDRAARALARGDLRGGAAALAALPRGPEGVRAAVQGVLVHRPRRAPTLSRAAVDRAAALAPLLFRLQETLAPPAAERLAQPALDDALDAVTEVHGAGALDLRALAAGEYGVHAGQDDAAADAEARAAAPPPALVAALVEALLGAAREGRDEAELNADTIAAALGDVGPAPPPSCELFLAPARRRRGAREGDGWLLGLHAPAGSSWGRFAGALGAPLSRALADLARAEREAHPGQERLDVAYAPSPALADLGAHPRVRARALALTSWSPDGDDDLALADLELVADPAAPSPLALRDRSGVPVAPSPLGRVRSTTAPPGALRLLAGWSLFRQHAPWALSLGPLAALARVPRVVLDGFVVAPASFRLPETGPGRPLERSRLRKWRREAGVPRFVQVGREDQLLPVDLDGARAAEDLVGHERVWEIWPPLGSAADRNGRRVEAVVALIDRGARERSDADARATAAAGRVPPPRVAPPARGFRTYKLFGAPEHAEALLLDHVHPAVAAAARARELTRWFFLRYVDGPGRRHHLRLRVHAATERLRAAFEARLERALAPARAAGLLTTVESAEYHPERARFGDALDAVHAIFQSDSEAACALLAEEDAAAESAPDRVTQVVRTLDALARGLGLDLTQRHALARARRAAEDAQAGLEEDPAARAEADTEFRARGRALRALLSAPDGLQAHVERTRRATRGLAPEVRLALAPALLHLACVRLAGPARDVERRAYTFWERTLEGLRQTRTRVSDR